MKLASSSLDSIEQKIKAEALRLGFSLCGITTAAPLAEYPRYEKWLADGCHAGMNYLSSGYHQERRHDPTLLVPEARSIISLGWSYPLRAKENGSIKDQAWIAGYASGEDYHKTLSAKMDELADFIEQQDGSHLQIHGFTDSAPILEREVAVRAGLGWIGKNSHLISPLFGSSILLAELFIDLPLNLDPLYTNEHCGTCTRCLQACPTACIRLDRTIDSRQCLSYLTIENKGEIPEGLRSKIGNWLFGCDLCQMVCPWNQKNIQKTVTSELVNWSADQVMELLFLSPDDFSHRFINSAIYRAKLKGVQRNALVFLGNQADQSTRMTLQRFLEKSPDADLAETARWALAQIDKSVKE